MAIQKLKDKLLGTNRKRAMAYKMLFDLENPHALVVLKDMCAAHGVFDGGFDEEPYLHAFNAGERNVVLRILTFLNMSIEDIVALSESEE